MPANRGTQIRFARRTDLAYLERERKEIRRDRLARKIDAKELVVAERGAELVGLLDLEFIQPETPYMSLIRVDGQHRREGIGSALLAFAEEYLRSRGFKILYTSSQADEPEPQVWHRRAGFDPCGSIEGFNEGGVAEVFFRKSL
jgi:GNAT superfamily N-acetyltransferase